MRDVHRHVGEPQLDRLEIDDRLAERRSLLNIGGRLLQCARSKAQAGEAAAPRELVLRAETALPTLGLSVTRVASLRLFSTPVAQLLRRGRLQVAHLARGRRHTTSASRKASAGILSQQTPFVPRLCAMMHQNHSNSMTYCNYRAPTYGSTSLPPALGGSAPWGARARPAAAGTGHRWRRSCGRASAINLSCL